MLFIVEIRGLEPLTFPIAIGTLSLPELINHSMYFLLFLFFISISLLYASDLVGNKSVWTIFQSFAFLV